MEKIAVGVIVGVTIGIAVGSKGTLGMGLVAIGSAALSLAGIASYLGHLRATEDTANGGNA